MWYMNMKKSLMFLLLLLVSVTVSAQKKALITEKDLIIDEAKKELVQTLANPESDFMKVISEKKVTGEYVFDITICEKGQVLSVFVVSSNTSDIKMQNLVKDLVKALEFNFKMPKGKSYKFQYTFNFK
jgi:hypothetical protein